MVDYERCIYLGLERETATDRLVETLELLSNHTSDDGVFQRSASKSDRLNLMTRMAGVITAHLCSSNWSITLHQYYRLCAVKRTAEIVFNLSGFGNALHLLEFNSVSVSGRSFELKPSAVMLVAIFCSLDDMPDDIYQAVLRMHPDQLLPLALAWAASTSVITPDGERRRGELIAARAKLADANFSYELALPLIRAWMLCSYADNEDKHEFKRVLNVVVGKQLEREKVKSNAIAYRRVERPKLIVAAERMSMGHAMHRSYAHPLAQLRRRFEVVLVVHAHNYTPAPEIDSMFDRIVPHFKGASLRDTAASIVREKPDVILYPSLGMQDWTVAMANLRLAPIQAMLLGHPAPAMTDTVDYTVLQNAHAASAPEYGSKVVVRRGYGYFAPHHNLPAEAYAKRARDDDALHIAVNSSALKLTPRFVQMCQRIHAASSRPLHFHFFPSVTGLLYDDLRQRLAQQFPRITIHFPMDYGVFLQELAQCDMALAAYPFGNTNSTVDTCMMGIPLVAYFSDKEVLSMGDRDVVEAAGLPGWLLARSDDEYFDAAMRLINDDAERATLRQHLLETDLRGRLFKPAQPEDETEFVDAMWWLYENHEAMQASTAHSFKVGESVS